MHPDLQRMQQAIEHAVRGMSSEQLAWNQNGKWSAAAILEHLSLTYSGTAKSLQRCLKAGQPSLNAANWRQRIAGFVVTGLRYMPNGRQAPAMVLPKGTAPETVLVDIQRNLAAADEAISRCEAQFGASSKISNHPILGPLTAEQWRTFHLVHGRHHMKQIARIRGQVLNRG